MWRHGSVRSVVVGLLVLAAVAGCSSGRSDGDAASSPPGETSPPALRPAGAPLWDGLVVPEGARLAGEVFVEIPLTDDMAASEDPLAWNALLLVGGSPFAAWDAMAGEVRDATGAPMPGSASSCAWTFPDGDPPVRSADAYEQALDVNVTPPEHEVSGVECWAKAATEAQVGVRTYWLHLHQDGRVPPTMSLRSDVSLEPVPDPTAYLASVRADDPDDPEGVPGPEPVAPDAASYLPEPAGQPDPPPEPGDEFGTEVNCFAGEGYARTVMPEGTRFVAEGWDQGTTTVIEVLPDATPDDVVDAFAAQFEGPGPDVPVDDTFELADGGEVRRYGFGPSAGGGYCELLTSPNGRFLRLIRNAD